MAFREELKLFLNILSNSKKIKSDGIFAGAKRQSWQANGASAQLMFPWKIVLMLTGDAKLDFWPKLLWCCKLHGVKLLVLSAAKLGAVCGVTKAGVSEQMWGGVRSSNERQFKELSITLKFSWMCGLSVSWTADRSKQQRFHLKK